MNHQSKIHKIESKDFKKSIHNKLISHKFNDIKEIELSINRNKIKDPFVLYVFGTARLELNELDDAEFLLKKSIEMSNLFFEAIVCTHELLFSTQSFNFRPGVLISDLNCPSPTQKFDFRPHVFPF